jgi:hypothetical protein
MRCGFARGFVNYQKWWNRLPTVSYKVYQLLSNGWWFSPDTPVSSTTKFGRHDIAEILLKVALNTKHQKIKYILKGKKHKLYGRDSVTSILRGPTIKPRLCRSLCVNLAFFLASVPLQYKLNLRTLSENIKCIYTLIETEKKSRQCTWSQTCLKRSSLGQRLSCLIG